MRYMNKPLQCGILGYGYMGEIRHRMVRLHPERMNLLSYEGMSVLIEKLKG